MTPEPVKATVRRIEEHEIEVGALLVRQSRSSHHLSVWSKISAAAILASRDELIALGRALDELKRAEAGNG